MKNAAIVNVESKWSTRVVSFPEGVSLQKGSFVRVAFGEKEEYVGRLMTDTMTLDESAYTSLCEYINPLGPKSDIRATAEIQMTDTPFEVVETKLYGRFLEGSLGTHYGKVGEPVGLKDELGTDLFVGDVVHLFDADGEYIGKRFVVKDRDGKAFVMGIKGACLQSSGKIGSGLTVYRYKHHEQVKDGEEYAKVRMVRKEWAG